MRLVRFGKYRREHFGILVTDSLILDLHEADYSTPSTLCDFLEGDGLARAREIFANRSDLKDHCFVDAGSVRLGPPVTPPMNFICIGRNYAEHAKEAGGTVPDHPLIFSKAGSTLCGPYDAILLPKRGFLIDYEVELAAIIGKEAYQVPEAEAFSFVAGYCLLNDVTARDIQKGERQWFRGKSFNSFAPCGPWLATADETPNPQALEITLKVNGEMRQHTPTSDMVFGVARLIADITADITLFPGDIISTGTPEGVALGRSKDLLDAVLKEGPEARERPEFAEAYQWYLHEGDVVEASCPQLGAQRNPVRNA